MIILVKVVLLKKIFSIIIMNKYEVIINKDDSGETMTCTVIRNKIQETYEKDKYKIIKILNTETNTFIYEYKQFNSTSPLNEFIKINNNIWWIGGKDYMTKIFFNCDTGDIYEDTKKDFIWTGPCSLSPDNKYILVYGCIWSFPYETRLYDISDLKNGYQEINMYDYFELKDYEDSESSDFDYIYKFVSNNKIDIYNINNEYINSVILP